MSTMPVRRHLRALADFYQRDEKCDDGDAGERNDYGLQPLRIAEAAVGDAGVIGKIQPEKPGDELNIVKIQPRRESFAQLICQKRKKKDKCVCH